MVMQRITPNAWRASTAVITSRRPQTKPQLPVRITSHTSVGFLPLQNPAISLWPTTAASISDSANDEAQIQEGISPLGRPISSRLVTTVSNEHSTGLSVCNYPVDQEITCCYRNTVFIAAPTEARHWPYPDSVQTNSRTRSLFIYFIYLILMLC
jgi:hypothetical protein